MVCSKTSLSDICSTIEIPEHRLPLTWCRTANHESQRDKTIFSFFCLLNFGEGNPACTIIFANFSTWTFLQSLNRDGKLVSSISCFVKCNGSLMNQLNYYVIGIYGILVSPQCSINKTRMNRLNSAFIVFSPSPSFLNLLSSRHFHPLIILMHNPQVTFDSWLTNLKPER